MQSNHHANNRWRHRIPPKGFFITGSDTEVGKTYISSLILRQRHRQGVSIGAYKPIASGTVPESGVEGDLDRLWNAIDRRVPRSMICPQTFQAPLAPPIAAEREQREIDTERFRSGCSAWVEHCTELLVEGAGGLLSPIAWRETNADLALDLGYPLIVVVPNRLGAIHQALSTLLAAQTLHLPVHQIVLNDVHPTDLEVFVQHQRLFLNSAPLILRTVPQLVHCRFQGTELDHAMVNL